MYAEIKKNKRHDDLLVFNTIAVVIDFATCLAPQLYYYHGTFRFSMLCITIYNECVLRNDLYF